MGNDQPALFVISIDVEMSWGAIHHGGPHDDRPYRDERRIVADVLALFERYDIAATWAVVGHLFLESCEPVGERKHPEIVRPTYPWLSGDWYDLDPCRRVDEAPTWYGPDLVDAIRASPMPQEIASHSFGHVIAGDPGCSRDAFRTDVAAHLAVADAAGLELRSFVFPRNSVGHLDVLQETGFTSYRSPPPQRFAHRGAVSRGLLRVVNAIRPQEWTAIRPFRQGGLVEIPQTYLFDPGSRRARKFGTRVWSLQQRRRLDHAIRTSSLFHLWFHTHNLAGYPTRTGAALGALLEGARTHIDAGRLENLTMAQVADRIGQAPERSG